MAEAYDNAARVPSNFWGAPVLRAADGTLSCPGFVGDTYSKRAWDRMYVAVPFVSPSQPYTPGVCEVTCDKARDVDKKKSKGSDGARITLAGLEPALVDIKVTIWTPQQLKELDTLRAIVFPGPQKKTTTVATGANGSTTTVAAQGDTVAANSDTVTRNTVSTTIPTVGAKRKTITKSVTVTQPFDVQHPVLDSYGVRSIIFVRVEGPVPGRATGTMVYTFKAIEFLPPAKGVNATATPTGSVARESTLSDSSNATPGQNSKNTDPT